MPNFLVIKTTDITGAPISATVTVQFGTDATPRRTSSTPNPGSMEISIPADQSTAVIFVSAPGVWDAKQGVKFVTASFGALDTPQLDFEGAQEINTKLLTISSRGNQFNHEVHLVLGQLRDATAKVDGILKASGITPDPSKGRLGLSLALPSQRIRDIANPILNPAGTGNGLINAALLPISIPGPPQGPIVFVAERQTTPKLVAIVHPGFANPTPGQPIAPLPYHLFFSPAIPNAFGADYPFGFNYCEFIDRYLILTGPDNSSIRKKLALAYQNLVAGPKNILVFPVAQGLLPQDQQMGDLNSQSAVLRLLQEVNYWVQRMRGASVPVQPVGPVALSCFSAGVRFLSKVIKSAKTPELFDNLLRHVFLFDPWFDGAKGQTEAVQFGQALLAWHRGGSSLRGLRVYTQFKVWKPIFDPPFRALPGASVIPGPSGAEEIESPAGTLLFTPLPFWSLVNPQLRNDPQASDVIHDEYPRRFLTHALKVSQFAP